MSYLIFILSTIALLIGFFVLTQYEERRGSRVFAAQRNQLDKNVARIEFILREVNLGVFLRNELRHTLTRMEHDIAHFSLQVVRSAERLLTRVVRYLRTRHPVDTAPRDQNVRPFVKTLSDFKSRIKAKHPEISDIQ